MRRNKKHERIVQLYRDGMSGTEIARKLGIPLPTVYGILNRSGVKMRPKGRESVFNTLEKVRALADSYERGETSTELAEKWGTTPSTVTRRLHAEGVKIRNPGHPNGYTNRTVAMAALAARMKSDGLMNREIGQKLGLSGERARQLVKIGRENSA